MRKLNASGKYLVLILLPLVLLHLSCRRDYSDGEPKYDVAARYGLMKGLASPVQTFTITAGTYTTIYGAKGTKLTFYPTSFKNSAGLTINSGQVEVTLLEMYSIGDMIANMASTLDGSDPLQSGGQIHIEARQGNVILEANVYGIGFRQRQESSQAMYLFTGGRNEDDSIVTWRDYSARDFAAMQKDSLGQLFFQFDSVSRFNWINCDRFASSTQPKTDLTVTTVSPEFNPGNTLVWIAYPDINGVGYFGTLKYGSSVFYKTSGVPIGTRFHLITITNKDGEWYYSQLLDQTVAAGYTTQVAPVKTTRAAVLASLAGL